MAYYYSISETLEKYVDMSDFWALLVYSGRNTGKTYSTLLYMYENKHSFTFVKRTNEDVDILCGASKRIGEAEADFSPWAPIHRDHPHINVKAVKLMKGIGAWYHVNELGEPFGTPIGYIVSLHAIKHVKGFNMDVEFLIFDEFIPQFGERVDKQEGNQLLDLYKTLDRDRIHRGLKPLRLICLANATEVNNPVFKILDLVDTAAMNDELPEYELYSRGIVLKKLMNSKEFIEKESEHPMMQALKDTSWGQMALGGSFAYNDFSNVGNMSIKHALPVCSVQYNHQKWYIYNKNGVYFVCFSKFNVKKPHYDLKLENDQKRFWYEQVIFLRDSCIEGNMLFKTYTMYDIIINYRKIFNL